ncbi:MAG: hypothetical protein R6X25_13815, partial [Candidatus Krumholzibacteriia bacterium]
MTLRPRSSRISATEARRWPRVSFRLRPTAGAVVACLALAIPLALAGCGDDGGEARAQTPARGAGAGGRPPEPAVPVAVQAAAP